MSVLREQLARGRVYAMLPQHKRSVEKALADIRIMLRRHPKSYVALSWGKQSIVLAHLVYRVDPRVLTAHWTAPDAALIGNFDQVRDDFLCRFPMPYSEQFHDAHLRTAVDDWLKTVDFSGVFIGLCAYESRARRHAVAAAGPMSIFESRNVTRCYPIGRWIQDDLAAYIATYNLPLLTPYHRYGLGVRTTTGSHPGNPTERAVDLMNSTNAAELRKRWRTR